HSLEMPWEAAMGLSSAKESGVAYLQNDAWKKNGIGDFLKGKYKPGLGGPGTGKGSERNQKRVGFTNGEEDGCQRRRRSPALNKTEETMRRGLQAALLSLIGLCASLPLAQAQSWPTKPITWVVPFGAGGGADVVSRIVAAALGEELKTNFIIENKPGASSTIGTRAIATAEPDGYAVGLLTDVHPVNVATGQAVPYEAFQDLAYISQLITVPMVLYGSPQRSLKTLKEVIEYGKANPGKLTGASIGPATPHHLTMQWLASMAGVKMTIVPYRSIPQGLQALVTGEADLQWVGAAAGQDLIATGKILQLGVATRQRLSRAPDMPTLIEQG